VDTSTGSNPGGFVPTVAGTYEWVAVYSSDPNNNPASNVGSPDEQVTVTAASPTITTPRPATAPPGGTLQDVANLTGGFNPTGTITFSLYAPGLNPAPIISKRMFLASADPSPAPPLAAGPARPLPALSTVRADIAFINGLYEDALGRDAKAAELAYWVSQLLLGVSRSTVAQRV
jgi:hypothetical protein